MLKLSHISKDKVSSALGAVVIISAIVSKFIPSANAGWPEVIVALVFGCFLLGIDTSKYRPNA